MRFVDLSHKITNNMPVYPGDAPLTLSQTRFIAKDGVAQYKLESAMHVGTHIDAPLHMIEKGKMISDFPISKFIGPGVVIDARGKKQIDASLLEKVALKEGDIVIVVTGWYKKFGSEDYFNQTPLVTTEFAEKLIQFKPSILGLDTPGPDEEPFHIHKILLDREIFIIENLTNTDELLGEKCEIMAVPLNIAADASLARVIARINE